MTSVYLSGSRYKGEDSKSTRGTRAGAVVDRGSPASPAGGVPRLARARARVRAFHAMGSCAGVRSALRSRARHAVVIHATVAEIDQVEPKPDHGLPDPRRNEPAIGERPRNLARPPTSLPVRSRPRAGTGRRARRDPDRARRDRGARSRNDRATRSRPERPRPQDRGEDRERDPLPRIRPRPVKPRINKRE